MIKFPEGLVGLMPWVRLEDGEALGGIDLYCSRHGLIGGADGIAVPAGGDRAL
ncbi:hypothetical protein GALLR39Z86_39750 [Glycomyces algeriensis]|uniref:Uncharacterized protein n=1 Tax=Glycomyces algeriensis TaxID=256037 RepID=A0A9W6GC21_9ACTN|nr:hypothetical protein GALLR39Z86_39750 [Glycomyces algeriensis]